eukprot:2166-Heterococcus_DN1.PRE.1
MRRDGNWQAVAAAMQKARAAGLRFDAHIYSCLAAAAVNACRWREAYRICIWRYDGRMQQEWPGAADCKAASRDARN